MTDAVKEGDQPQKESLFSIGDREYTPESAKTKIENLEPHVAKLEAENKELRDNFVKLGEKFEQDSSANSKLEEVLEKLNQKSAVAGSEDKTLPLDIDALKADILNQATVNWTEKWESQEQGRIKKANLNVSEEAAVKAYGNDWEDSLVKRGRELGYDKASVISFMESNPVAFKELFVPKKVQSAPEPQGTIRSPLQQRESEIPSITKHWHSADRVNAGIEAYKIVEARLRKEGKL